MKLPAEHLRKLQRTSSGSKRLFKYLRETALNELSDSMATASPAESESHIPVMLKEVLQHLNLKPGARVLDCTLGLAGHAVAIAEIIGAGGEIIGIDRDQGSLEKARQWLQSTAVKCQLRQADFRNLDEVLKELGGGSVDAILFDLGISSYQLDDPQRGFSLKSDGPLDMRMDQGSYISAYELVNSLSERELSSIIKNFGEERWHNRIARVLVQERLKKPIETTQELSEVILKAIPHRYQHQRIHPATRTFQAIRIAVNRELEALELALTRSLAFLKVGGRICVISFHSLEDRIVKETFRKNSQAGVLKIISKKPLRPEDQEINNNPRSRSARLRVAERTK